MRSWSFVLVLLAFTMPGLAQQPTPAAKPLYDLFAAEWDYDMQQMPDEASTLGDRRWNDRWPDDSLEAFARRNQHDQDVLTRLSKIARGTLAPVEQLNYDLFQKRYQDRIE